MDGGRLVPDEVVDALVAERLGDDDAESGFILDGYPRNRSQAGALDRVLDGDPLDRVLFIAVPDDMLTRRLLARGQGRADDTEDVILERLTVYRSQTEPLVAHYRQRGLPREIDGRGSIDAVRENVHEALA
jgi:adenylate kinase